MSKTVNFRLFNEALNAIRSLITSQISRHLIGSHLLAMCILANERKVNKENISKL